MCGIAGAFGTHAAQRATAAALVLQHRGPEGSGIYVDPTVPLALAHQRLCIIDGSATAAQPMHYAGRYVLVHNGELYNYTELRSTLTQQGYTFVSNSDTEVIIAAYARWGDACLERFDGAFAFAIWDTEEQTLFAARDRMGEKPFFFAFDGTDFSFASEMKALWAAGLHREADSNMLYNYLTLGYTTNPFAPTATFYRHIQQLPPASFLRYKGGATELSIERYWQVAICETPITDQEAISRFRELLTHSVTRRLRSDVPIGTSLSGGLDSSTIVALCAAQKATNYSQQCFTASFPDFERDETPYAALVAKKFGLQHHIVPVGVTDLLHNMEALSRQQEAPVQSASALAQWQVYAAAKAAGVTVLLDGQGADELLAGYEKYYRWYWRELYAQRKLNTSGETTSARALGVQASFSWKDKAAALAPHFTASLWQQARAKQAAAQPGLHPQFVAANKASFAYAQPAIPTLNGVLHYNSFTNGLEELLRYADRNSMAHAVEVRLPFLQHELIEFLFELPPSFKIRNGWTKWLLRVATKDLLPESIAWRKDKVGFEPPQHLWMQDARVQQEIHEAKECLVAEGILSPDVLQQSVRPGGAHDANNLDWRYWSASYLYR